MIRRVCIAIALLAIVACDAQLGNTAESQAIGSRGLSFVTTDNDTLQGSGLTTNTARLKKVYVDGTTLTGTGSAGSPITAPWSAVGGHVFGDASDGDVTISGDTTLARDMVYDDLTVDGATLTLGGHRVFVAGVLTFLNSARISVNGAAASGATAGAGAAGSNLGGGANGGAGGTTGIGAIGTAQTDVARGCSATAAAGGTAGTPTGTTGLACHGGGGGRGSGGNGGAGGTITLAAAAQGDIHSFRAAIEGAQKTVATSFKMGSGGAGGGGSATGSGGGGGGGAGYAVVLARTVNASSCHANGCIQARGGNGGNADGAGNGGGGAGGGGGIIVFVIGSGSYPSMSEAGGTHGNLAGTGGNGGDGGAGFEVKFKVGY